ncbi:hypothetical protein [Rhodopirellula sp. P2]|uniref:hypothetical protein n=1 Tax=Rhodopirellula sp. P2 TaxID=2127060 RepID=UPI0023689990|nr:hypothetical protein [Rhodopirellula sp. P2]WDQ17566.1 hypothetical protein PSR62_03205 [Rhodopirellula sp. P2]
MVCPLLALFSCGFVTNAPIWADGDLTLRVVEESTGEPTIARMELTRQLPVTTRRTSRPKTVSVAPRRSLSSGPGFVLDEFADLSLQDGAYEFKLTRGPESRVLRGTFDVQRGSEDEHQLALPRMVRMRPEGWTSGDCLLPRSPESLPMRMTAEDLHLANVIRDPNVAGRGAEKPIPRRNAGNLFGEDNSILTPQGWPTEPLWIDANVDCLGGLAFYRDSADSDWQPTSADEFASEELASLGWLAGLPADSSTRVAVENPFAWLLPIWLASEKVDGVFVLGDWLQLNESVTRVPEGRMLQPANRNDATQLGRDAEQIHWQLLEAGFRLSPMAGSGDDPGNSPVGYNRLYVAGRSQASSFDSREEAVAVGSKQDWWQAAWEGCSFATNGPLMRTNLDGRLPGHVFEINPAEVGEGESVELTAEVILNVRDPVEYLEVIHNGRLHYSAKLDEFAKAGGRIPPLKIKESGWATVRVVTLHEDHYRAVISSPWYFEVGGQPRITARSVAFFKEWLGETEQRLAKLPPDQLKAFVPYVRAARKFWAERAALAGA